MKVKISIITLLLHSVLNRNKPTAISESETLILVFINIFFHIISHEINREDQDIKNTTAFTSI